MELGLMSMLGAAHIESSFTERVGGGHYNFLPLQIGTGLSVSILFNNIS